MSVHDPLAQGPLPVSLVPDLKGQDPVKPRSTNMRADIRNSRVQNMPFETFRAYYYSDTDALSVFLIKTVPGLIEETNSVLPGLHVDYTADQQIVRFDIVQASKRLKCHFWDALCEIDGQPPCVMSRDYMEDDDTLVVQFQLNLSPETSRESTDDKDILVGVNPVGKWEYIVIGNAVKRIAQNS